MNSKLSLSRYLVLMVGLMLLNACLKPAVQGPPPVETNSIPDTVVYETWIDPLELEDPDLHLDDTPLLDAHRVDIQISEPDTQEVMGYRVQLISTPDFAYAQEQLELVRSQLADAGVFFQYDPPHYKIRIGNCRDRKDADRLARRARGHGFHDAWVVRSRVILVR